MPAPLPVLQDTEPISCLPIGTSTVLDAEDAVGLAVRLKALADPVRLQLVAHLLGAPEREACTCDLAPLVGLTEATVSHHLSRLRAAGLVTKRRDGTNVQYRLVPEALAAVSRTLDPGC